MELELAKKIIPNINNWSLKEIEELELLSKEEIEYFLHEFEEDSGDYSNWDCMRMSVTCLYYMQKNIKNK